MNNNIFNFKVEEDYSVTSVEVDLMPTYSPTKNLKDTSGVIFYKSEEEIQELKTSKIYKKGNLEYRISSIDMNFKTDQAIFYALLSQNKEEFSISIKDLALKIGVAKDQAGSKKIKERIMNSINKHRCFDFTLLKEGIFHTGFSILSYTFDMPQKDHITIYFDKQFLNLYKNSNNSIINLNKYLKLKNEYSKLIYSMINNFFNKDLSNEITIYPDVFRKKLSNIDENGKTTKITPQQRQKIKNALKELKEAQILKTCRFNKNDSLVFKIKEGILKQPKLEEKIMEIENNERTTIATKISQLREQSKLAKGVVELSLIESNIELLEKELKESNQIKKEVLNDKVDIKQESLEDCKKQFEEELNAELLKEYGTTDADEILNMCSQPSKITIIKKIS